MSMKGYKIFNPDWTCRGFKYEVGKTYKHNGDIKICESGFHFCEEAGNCLHYYPLDITFHMAEVEATGLVITNGNKSVTDEIKIVRELSWEEICNYLSEDKDWNVRCRVAENPNTPIDVLTKLSEDEDSDVRYAVAANPNTPVDVLTKLSEDKDWDVRYEVAANPNTPVDVLTKLSEDEDWNVRCRVAENPNTPT